MSAYLVRLIESKELVGFFAADDLDDLGWLVDEVTDPCACEYKRVAHGGIVWEDPDTPIIRDDEHGNDLSGAAFSDGMADAVFDERRWKPILTCPLCNMR